MLRSRDPICPGRCCWWGWGQRWVADIEIILQLLWRSDHHYWLELDTNLHEVKAHFSWPLRQQCHVYSQCLGAYFVELWRAEFGRAQLTRGARYLSNVVTGHSWYYCWAELNRQWAAGACYHTPGTDLWWLRLDACSLDTTSATCRLMAALNHSYQMRQRWEMCNMRQMVIR